MGDRVVIQVKGAPCAAYLHWGGDEAIDLLKKAVPRMRKGDDGYSQARLIGVLHENMDGNCSLGVLKAVTEPKPTEGESHGDAGIVLYDCDTGMAECYHGYLADQHKKPIDIGIPPG